MRKQIVFLIFCFIPFLSFASCERHNGIGLVGDYLQLALPITAFGMTVAYQDMEGSKQFLKNFLFTELTTQSLKHTIHEKRPCHGKYSFPSGHTAVAFSGAGFIQMRYGWTYGAPAYACAAYVGFSRFHVKAHWVHDVLAGAAIGLFYSYLFTTPFVQDYNICPIVNRECAAISFGTNF